MADPDSNARILVVDDDEDFLFAIGRLIGKAGYEIESVPDAETAIASLRRSPPLLVLTDLRLPGKSGLDLLRDSRMVRPGVPVVILTAYGDDEARELARDLGADGFLTKPPDRDELLRTIRQAIGNGAAPPACEAPGASRRG
jgi:DNA-binding response OmpR family regulator